VALESGTRIGHYEITAQVGAGGMGEVYRARDTRLGRDVAIKVLRESMASKVERLARFEREARALAALNHPNIAAIYGVEETDSATALVMELVEGPTLADRIAQGAIPVEEALPIAKQIAEALEAAHESGIVHRDLKPANIKVRPDGTVKVLDFGLAKAMEPGPVTPATSSQLSTITTPAMTQAGTILGTAAYMSPEQASGRPVDHRSDLWSFGIVLFEALTGRRVFAGDTVSDVLAAILKDEPQWSALPADTPTAMHRLLRRCLVKDRRRRTPVAAAALLEIEDALSARPDELMPPDATPFGPRWGPWAVAATAVLLSAALAVPAWRHLREEPAPAPLETRTEISTPATDDPVSFALSPDGTKVVYVAAGEGGPRLWLRPLASSAAQPLDGTEGATSPFWSPDSGSIGFFAGGRLKRLDLPEGQPQVLASATAPRGAAWHADGFIVFAPTVGPLFQVAATGGDPVPVTKLGTSTSHRFPHFLPGGRQFLFFVQGTEETQGIYLGSLDASDARRLTASDTGGVFLAPGQGLTGDTPVSGWLVWMQGGSLRAQRLDVASQRLTGDPVTLAASIEYDTDTFAGGFSVSSGGVLAYRSTAGAQRRQLAWFDRTGKPLGPLGTPDENRMQVPRVSPDSRRVVVQRTVEGNTDLWLLDGARTSRFTFDAALDRNGVWSFDGRSIAFDSNRSGVRNIYVKPSGGAGAETELVRSPQNMLATDWSRDGRFLLFFSVDPQNARDIWVAPLEGDRTPWVFLQTRFDERWAHFSPDGRWVAYMSNESGNEEIYVRPFTERGRDPVSRQWQVSTGGGIHPTWRPDGRELYFLAPDGQMMGAPIDSRGTELNLGTPVALFPTHIVGGGADALQFKQYDIAPDGRFLINTPSGSTVASPITILQNWRPAETR
jgi:serine/threonine protein kinase